MKTLVLSAVAASLCYAGAAHAQAYCREFSQGVVIGGQRQSSYGYACMQPDGSWQIISSEQGGGYMPPPPPMQPVYMPPPVAYYPPPPPIQRTGFSISFGSGGVPYYRGGGDCDDRRGWRKHKHHHHDYHDRGWGGGWGHGRGRDWDDD